MVGEQETILWFLLFIATVTDLFYGKIYNVLTIPVFILGIGTRFFFGGVPGISLALQSLTVAMAFFI